MPQRGLILRPRSEPNKSRLIKLLSDEANFLRLTQDWDHTKNASYILRSRFSHNRNLFGNYCRGGSWYGLPTGIHFVRQEWQLVCTRRGDGRGRNFGATVRPFEGDTAASAPVQPLVSKLGSLRGLESAQELG
jgi:hypothetical protein